jgi:hypothetical protein
VTNACILEVRMELYEALSINPRQAETRNECVWLSDLFVRLLYLVHSYTKLLPGPQQRDVQNFCTLFADFRPLRGIYYSIFEFMH